MKLAKTVVGLCAVEGEVFMAANGGISDLSEVGRSREGMDTLAEFNRGCIVGWFHRQGCQYDKPEILLEFALAQQGDFEAELITGIAKCIPKKALPRIVAVLKGSNNMQVKYACLQVIRYACSNGEGIPTVDDFVKRSDVYIRALRDVVRSSGMEW
ncbi:MAG: hypothetical protein IT578_02405 [Verrucomicrobiae bacterium]|nr:hypothetical protein [Verrucomicrobiae bacterium]